MQQTTCPEFSSHYPWLLPKLVAVTTSIPKTRVGRYNLKASRDDLDRFPAIVKEIAHAPA